MAARIEASDVVSRLWLTLGPLVIYRLGTYVPLPGVDLGVLQSVFYRSGGPPAALDIFSGGAFARLSIFQLGVFPYITASFWLLLLSAAWQRLRRRKLHTKAPHNSLDWVARIAAIALAGMEGYGIALGFEGASRADAPLVPHPAFVFEITTTATIMGATGALLWLADRITLRGLGNGVALLLFSDMVARLPSTLAALVERGRAGTVSISFLVPFLALAVVVVAGVVFMESAQRRILVQYGPRIVGNMMFEGEGSYLRLKLNTFGIIPPIFASSLLLWPTSLATYSAGPSGDWVRDVIGFFSHGRPGYLALYVALIVPLAFWYSAVVFNPKEMAESLRGYAGVIAGQEPGLPIAHHLRRVLARLTAVGAIYVAGICVLPEILVFYYQVPFYLGGTSLLVLVCISMDLVGQIRAHLLPSAAHS
jgi:preprotein translocase subunit SecY